MMHGWQYLREEDRQAILEGIARGNGRAAGGPFHLEIDPADRCNARCFFCSNAHLKRGDILGWPRLEALLDEAIDNGLRSYRLAGGGEPLIYPHLRPLCQRMAKAGLVLDNVTTNGLALDRALDDLLLSPPAHLFVSLNYATAEKHARFMGTSASAFERVLANIRLMDERLKAEGRRGDIQILTQFFVHRSTVEDIPRMVDLMLDLPLDMACIRVVGGIPQEESVLPEQHGLLRDLLDAEVSRLPLHFWLELDLAEFGLGELSKTLIARLQGRDIGAPLSEDACPQPEQAATGPSSPIEQCYIGWHSMVIQGNGDTHPCCYLMPEREVPPFGNVNQQSIGEVWNGPLFRRFRREMRTVMLMGCETPLQRRRFQCTTPMCWTPHGCPITSGMADAAFYRAAHQRLEILRRRPLTRMARAANRLTRAGIDKARARAKR